MKSNELKGKRIAIVATDGFEQSELIEPLTALRAAGATVEVVAPKPGKIQGMKHQEKGDQVPVDRTLGEAKAEDYAGLVLPGGVANPDTLRMDRMAVAFIRQIYEAGKPIGAICHGPRTLIEIHAVKGRTVTSWPSLKTDLKNAGANWVDQEVVVDDHVITSRKPEDLPAFCRAIIQEFRDFHAKAA